MLSFKDETMVIFSNARGEMDNTPYDFSNTLLQPVNLQDTEVGLKDISFPSYVHVNHEDFQCIITKDTMTSGTLHGKRKCPCRRPRPIHVTRPNGLLRIHFVVFLGSWFHSYRQRSTTTHYRADQQAILLPRWQLRHRPWFRACLKRQHRNNLHARWWCRTRIVLQSTFGHPDRSSHTGTPKDEQWSLYGRAHVLRPSEIIDAVQGLWHRESIGSPFGPSSFSAICGVELGWTQLEHVHGRRHSRRRIWMGHFYSVPMQGFVTQFLDDPFFEANPQRQPERLFIYANFVDETWVGEEQKPLLSVIGNPDMRLQESRPSCHVTFRNIGYVKAASKVLTNLRVWIEDEHGNKRGNVRGTTMLVLHFRHNRKRI